MAEEWREASLAGKPYAEVAQAGRWTWKVEICHDILTWGPFTVLGGRRSADRVARRKLADYTRARARQQAAHRITLEG
jgi:hypothetical protein